MALMFARFWPSISVSKQRDHMSNLHCDVHTEGRKRQQSGLVLVCGNK